MHSTVFACLLWFQLLEVWPYFALNAWIMHQHWCSHFLCMWYTTVKLYTCRARAQRPSIHSIFWLPTTLMAWGQSKVHISKKCDVWESYFALAAMKCQTSLLQLLKDFYQMAPVDIVIAGMNEDIIHVRCDKRQTFS